MSLSKFLLKRRARSDAPLDVESVEDEVTEALGPRPEFSPVTNAEHAEIQRRRENRRLIEEMRSDLAALKQQATRHTHPWLLGALIAATVLVEGLGGIFLIAISGAEGGHRVVYGVALALFLVVFTALVAKRVRGWSDQKRTIGQSLWTVLVVISYAAVIGTIAILRVIKSAEESSLIEASLVGLMMMFVTCGPAWFAEDLIRKIKASSQLWSEMANDQGQIRLWERERSDAEQYVRKIARVQTSWDREAAQIRSAYAAARRREAARVERANARESFSPTGPAAADAVANKQRSKQAKR